MSLASGPQKHKQIRQGLPGRTLRGSLLGLVAGPLLLTVPPFAAWNTSLMAGAQAATLDCQVVCNEGHVLRQWSKERQKGLWARQSHEAAHLWASLK